MASSWVQQKPGLSDLLYRELMQWGLSRQDHGEVRVAPCAAERDFAELNLLWVNARLDVTGRQPHAGGSVPHSSEIGGPLGGGEQWLSRVQSAKSPKLTSSSGMIGAPPN
jgi:hypothetical protein